MKILIVTPIYPSLQNPVRGTFVRTQVEYLKRAGIEVELFVLEGRPRKLVYLRAVTELRRRLASSSIDLVHAHYSYAGIIARTQWRVPLVVSYCGDDLLGTVNARGRQTWFGKLAVFAGRVLSRHVDAVIVKSHEMAGKLKRKDVHVIPNEVDLNLFQPRDRDQSRRILGLHPGKKYLLFAANPDIPVKRFPLAKQVADCLARQDPTVELLVVHNEPQNQLPLFMNACDALVFTSFQEGSPNIVKQAMACNLPIVSTDVGDVREIIGNAKGCYICEPDAQKFASVLTGVLRYPARTNGRQQVQHLAGASVARQIIAVYEYVLRNCRHLSAHRAQSNFLIAGK
ncbi:MAG: glycosyltransferase [Candidatus Acidiferrum sp.]